MTSPMLEKAARALCESQGFDPDAPFRNMVCDVQDFPAWQAYVKDARAVIAAIREPTEVMVAAGRNAPEDMMWRDSISAHHDAVFRAKWFAAIDTILSEGETK